MADNYLEKRMDDHRRGIDNTKPRRNSVSPAPVTAGNAVVAIPDISAALQRASALIAEGYHVTILTTDSHTMRRHAAHIGATPWPVASFATSDIDAALSLIRLRRGEIHLLAHA